MRERLSELGVHYLLLNALDEPFRERFLIQLLLKGVEQRTSFRLYQGGDLHYWTKSHPTRQLGRLVELSLEGCRILTQDSFEEGTPLTALLPPELGGGDELELSGVVLRTADHDPLGGYDHYATVIQFDELDDAKRAQLEGIIRGERVGTKVTPLATLPEEAADNENSSLDANRRAEVRYDYDRHARILGVGPTDANPVLGRDLSLGGVRLSDCAGLEAGSSVAIALFGAAREEPTVLEATVVRTSPVGEAALSFSRLSSRDRKALEKLFTGRPVLDALDQPDSAAGRTIVAEVRTGASKSAS